MLTFAAPREPVTPARNIGIPGAVVHTYAVLQTSPSGGAIERGVVERAVRQVEASKPDQTIHSTTFTTMVRISEPSTIAFHGRACTHLPFVRASALGDENVVRLRARRWAASGNARTPTLRRPPRSRATAPCQIARLWHTANQLGARMHKLTPVTRSTSGLRRRNRSPKGFGFRSAADDAAHHSAGGRHRTHPIIAVEEEGMHHSLNRSAAL